MKAFAGGTQVSTQTPRGTLSCGRLAALVACCAWILLLNGHARSDQSGNPPFRVAFASSMFVDVNENDARVAVKMWARTLAQDRGIPADPEPRILNGVEAIANALRGRLVDAVALTTHEYWLLGREAQSEPFVAAAHEGSITEEYVLLVHRNSGIERIGDLRGRSLSFLRSPRMSLAQAWLDVFLVKSGFLPAARFCGRVTQIDKLSRTVLPVFFRQSDACVVTRRGFQTMSELNPQVGRQLKVLASSPEVVPAGFCFRKDYTDPCREKLLVEMDRIHTIPAGQQVLTIFQCERLAVRPLSCLDSAFELLSEHRRLSPVGGR
jgi:phosphonate transport system substrate-binding protein